MTATYTLTISIEAHEYFGDFYVVGEGYETGSAVLKHVAADQILAMNQAHRVEQYLLDTLQEGENASKAEYERASPDVACGIHFDVNYQRFSFWAGDRTVEIGTEPTKRELRSLADELSV